MRTTFKSFARTSTLILISVAFASSVMADDDDDDHGRRHGRKHKEEYWEGNCKIERKWEKDGDYKEKRKCKGGVYHQAQPVLVQPVTVIYPPWVVVEQGRPHHYRSGYEPAPVQQAQVSYCTSETVGKVLGGLTGAVLGNQVGKGNGRVVATIGGAIAGVLVGGEVGRLMDARDQACVGQALELAPAGRGQFKCLADTSLISRIHETANFAAHQNAGDGTANRGNDAAITFAHLVSEYSACEATQHLPDRFTGAVAHLRLLHWRRLVPRAVVMWPALFNYHPRRVDDGDGLYQHWLRLMVDTTFALALFLVVAVLLPLAFNLAIALPVLLLVLATMAPAVIIIIIVRHHAGRKGD